MSPAFKYSYGRLGLFLLCFLVLLPTPLNILVKAMVALLVSAVLALFVLRKWRDQMGDQLSTASSRRAAEKARLRAALAGDEDAAAAGDRVVAASTARKSDEDDENDEDEPQAAAVDAVKAGPPDGPVPAAAGEEK
jgi:hypothetical protein